MDIGRFSPLTYTRDVKVFPHDAHTLLGAFSVAAVSDAGSLYRSPDLGATWTLKSQKIGGVPQFT
jgi:hypothetical protein